MVECRDAVSGNEEKFTFAERVDVAHFAAGSERERAKIRVKKSC
jgi:hypothetical protein